MMHCALVTGASGFVGACLVRYLLQNGWRVHLLLREQSHVDAFSASEGQLTVHRCDGSYDSIEQIVKASAPDVVYHLASLFLAQHQTGDIARLIESNLLFPTLLLEAMHKCGVRNLINTGTSWQNYENLDCKPANLYAASKEAFEKLALFYIDAYGIKMTTLRLFDTYGPGDKRKKLFYLLRETARSGAVLNMSPGEQIINAVYGEDVAAAFLLAGEELLASDTSANRVYGVSAEKLLSLRELVAMYSAVTEYAVNVNWGALPYRPREVMSPWTNYVSVPGWQQKTSLVDGIMAMESDVSLNGLKAYTITDRSR